MLTDISEQVQHFERDYTPDQWKCIFLHDLGRVATDFLPSLYGEAFIPYGQSSSDLSKEEMTEMIESMFAFGAEHDVVFHDDKGEFYAGRLVDKPELIEASEKPLQITDRTGDEARYQRIVARIEKGKANVSF